jgi:hypothetical protein
MYFRIVHFPNVCPTRECLLVSIDIICPAAVAGGEADEL